MTDKGHCTMACYIMTNRIDFGKHGLNESVCAAKVTRSKYGVTIKHHTQSPHIVTCLSNWKTTHHCPISIRHSATGIAGNLQWCTTWFAQTINYHDYTVTIAQMLFPSSLLAKNKKQGDHWWLRHQGLQHRRSLAKTACSAHKPCSWPSLNDIPGLCWLQWSQYPSTLRHIPAWDYQMYNASTESANDFLFKADVCQLLFTQIAGIDYANFGQMSLRMTFPNRNFAIQKRPLPALHKFATICWTLRSFEQM